MRDAIRAYFLTFSACLVSIVEPRCATWLAVSEWDTTTSVSNTLPGNTMCKSGRF